MPRFIIAVIAVLAILTASCAGRETRDQYGYAERVSTDNKYATSRPPPMDPERRIVEQDCRGPVDWRQGNLRCI